MWTLVILRKVPTCKSPFHDGGKDGELSSLFHNVQASSTKGAIWFNGTGLWASLLVLNSCFDCTTLTSLLHSAGLCRVLINIYPRGVKYSDDLIK